MNPKYEKVCAEIDKTRTKVADLQNRLRELERQKTELENSEIVAAFRSTNVSPQQLAEYIKAFQQDSVSAAAPADMGSTAAASPTISTNKEDSEVEED